MLFQQESVFGMIYQCAFVCSQVQKRVDDIRRTVAECDPQNRPVPPTLQEQ